ncbi:MAG: U4/U6 small nuclear ribonucleoprotein Prp4, partial [Paramarteilia canceri]
IWSYPSCQPVKTLSGHSDKLTALDITSDSSLIISTSFDQTFKKWTKDELNL